MRALVVLAIVVVVVAVAGVFISLQPRIGDVVETLDVENATFRIRIENRDEVCGMGCLPGAYYVFLSSPKGAERWREIMTFRHDDPGPIPRDQMRFVNEQVAFVFMGWMYAVTTNGGASWSVWNAQTDLPEWDCCNYLLIKTLAVRPDGTGTMTLQPIAHRRGEVPSLSTTDFGRHWKADTKPR